jgi:hypothetical protein
MAGWMVLLVSVLGGLLLGLFKRPPLLLILALNLVPVAGVLWAGWSPLQLLLLYWIENVAVGVFNYLKLRGYEAHSPARPPEPFKLSSFFAMHYGMFTLVHGVFALVVGSFFGGASANAGAWAGLDWLSFAAAALSLVAIHLTDWLRWRAAEGWNEGSADGQMFAPYGRVIVMHLTVLGGAFILAATKAPVAYVALLAVLKTFIETGWAMMGQKESAAAGPMTMEMNGRRWTVGGGKPARVERIKDE